jgi:mannose-1-phosphate guanylyltransferase
MARAFTIVMAGGSGTRFWPLSTPDRPKQFLPLAGGDDPLLVATVARAARFSARTDVLVVTSERLAEATRRLLPDLPRENVLAEPVGRNTAPCIAWAAARVVREDPDALCAVLAADHFIDDVDAFATTALCALGAAEHGDIVTIGIRPTRPETGYGYVEMGEQIDEGVFRAQRFVEKPNKQRAGQFLAAGRFLWNSGMFFFRGRTMLDAIRAHLPALGEVVDRIAQLPAGGDEAAIVRDAYPTLPDVSIDHGVMEKVRDVAVVPASFGWTDVGSYEAAWELAERDAEKNSVPDGAIVIDSTGSYVRTTANKKVALIGVSDLVVIETEDALLIVPRARAQDVKLVTAALAKRGDRS